MISRLRRLPTAGFSPYLRLASSSPCGDHPFSFTKKTLRMKINGIVVLLLILFLAFILNPGYSKHMAKLRYKEKALSRFNTTGDSYTGKYKYHNYYIFSTTTGTGGDTKSIGLLGFVIKN
jgi:hypothetical protein